ncbi:MAG: PAS domain S-box protein, partial [Rhodocyclaceae bacterium]|nr:PAS domain S-box protein [Rhodocyclaceae bacterium]
MAAHAERLQKHGDDLTAANRLLEREVRDRRLAEMELRKLGTALEQCPAVVLVCGLNGRIEYANAAFTLCTGFRMDEALGRDPLLLLAGMAARQDQPLVWGRISAASGWSGELRNRRKSGEQYLERVTVTPVHGADGTPTHYLWVGEDISEQTRVMAELLRYRDTLEELVAERTAQLAAARDAAQQASRAKGTFLANMSHEIRTALNAVIGLTHILSRQISDAAQRRTLRRMDGAARHLLAVVNDILDLSKIEAGAIVLEAVPFVPAQIVENAVEIMRPRADTKNLPLLCDIAAGLQGRTYVGDPTRLSQVLLNFVSNAVKFTERGEVRLGMALEEEDATSALLRFEVRDTGRGIARAAQERLFKEFEQADDTITRLYGGSGLGLAINRRLVELMGGSIFVDSAPGRGSTFVFTARVAQLTGTGCVDAALDVDHAR